MRLCTLGALNAGLSEWQLGNRYLACEWSLSIRTGADAQTHIARARNGENLWGYEQGHLETSLQVSEVPLPVMLS